MQKVKTSLRTALGIFLIIFGLAGMILPVLPGWWIIPIGLQLLGLRLVIDRKKSWHEIISVRRHKKLSK